MPKRLPSDAQGKSPAAVRSDARCLQLAWSLVPLFTGKGTEDCCPNLRTLQRPWIGTSNPCYWPNELLIKLAGLAKGLWHCVRALPNPDAVPSGASSPRGFCAGWSPAALRTRRSHRDHYALPSNLTRGRCR